MRLNTVQLSRMDITDPFWKQYTDLVEDVIIPYQWDIMKMFRGWNPAIALRILRLRPG